MDFENVQGELYGSANPTRSRLSRAEMEKYHRQLPDGIKAQLKGGKLRLGDFTIYSIKAIGTATTIKMFESQDTKERGLRNISGGKLPKNQVMVVSGIYLLAGVAPAAVPGSPTTAEIKATVFGSLGAAARGAIANGEFSLSSNKETIVPETSNRIFVTDNNHNWPLGYYKLDNPRLIQDDVDIEFQIELGTTEDIPQDTYLYVALHGSITTP